MTRTGSQLDSAGSDSNRKPPGQSSAAPRSLDQLIARMDFQQAGERMHSLIADLYPICRSITGDGLRETLRTIGRSFPLEIREVPTGMQVFDWTIPKEWNIRDAWIKNSAGEKIIDFHKSNLHVVNYSTPVHCKLPLAELREHLHTLPDRPDWIPYRTSYYSETWGFCLAHKHLQNLCEGEYEVHIDSELVNGSLSYGEFCLPGERSEEVLFSCHACHPSLCNDNLSGVALVAALAEFLQQAPWKYTYRFLFIPGCIGSITWLALNENRTQFIRNGLVVACVGDAGKLHYKRSRRGNATIDRAVIHALRQREVEFEVRDFSPYGYDERQYCSPAFNLAVGSLTRTPHGRFPQYHTSADDLTFVRPESLGDSMSAYLSVISILENNGKYINANPKCEPQLGKRGLYRALGGFPDAGQLELAMLWVLNLSDGNHELLDIAERAELPFELVVRAARALESHDLLNEHVV